ncbi:17997_t:CDS:2, partial [Gigaspora margarita]
ISETEILNGRQDETSKAHMLARIYEELPHYFTRQCERIFKGSKFNTFWDETETYFNKQWVCLIAADNKHKLLIGEDVAFSIGVRNRCSIIAQESILAATDYDFSKLSLTPLVIFFISISNNISGSFYDGLVFVSYKDTVFEPKSELKKYIAGIQEILNNRTERLQLKNNKFKYYSLASKDDITKIFESIFRIGPTLKIEKTTQTQIHHHLELVKFIDTHCQARAYSFQIKKCNNFSCLYCKPIRLLSQEFDNLSLLPDPIPSKALTNDELHDYQQALESYSYSCGAPIFSDDHYLCEVIFVRTQINCDSLIEILYYSSHKEENYSICY